MAVVGTQIRESIYLEATETFLTALPAPKMPKPYSASTDTLRFILGAFPVYKTITIISMIGVVVTAAYFLWIIQKIFLGPFNQKWSGLTDMIARELITTVPLIVIMIVLGIFPGIVLDTFTQTVNQLVSILK